MYLHTFTHTHTHVKEDESDNAKMLISSSVMYVVGLHFNLHS